MVVLARVINSTHARVLTSQRGQSHTRTCFFLYLASYVLHVRREAHVDGVRVLHKGEKILGALAAARVVDEAVAAVDVRREDLEAFFLCVNVRRPF